MTAQLTAPTDRTRVSIDALDDVALAHLAKEDSAAFAILYRRNVARVYRYLLLQTANQHDAEDLTSHVFMQAIRRIRQYRGESEFATWLIGIARYAWLDRLRTARHPTISLDDIDLPDEVSLDEIVSGRMRLAEVIVSMRVLSPDRAEAVALRVFADLPFAEVARLMHKSEAATKMLVSRGLADLRARLANPDDVD